MKRARLVCRWTLAALLIQVASLFLAVGQAPAQIVTEDERNVSEMADFQNECAIAIDPTNRNELFVACNKAGAGLFFARSIDRGHSWIYPDPDKAIADGDMNQGQLACCDPSVAWDSFGNLYVTYLGDVSGVKTLLSTDGGQTFEELLNLPGSADQPTIVAEDTSDPNAPVAVWIVWNLSGEMASIGFPVHGLGSPNIGPFPFAKIVPGTNTCSFGDVAVAPSGAVVQVCQYPTMGESNGRLRVNIDPDGIGPQDWGMTVTPEIPTNVGGHDRIPAQDAKGIDGEAGLAYDRNPASPHFGRLYLVYTEEVTDELGDTDIMLRYSDNDGRNWNPTPIRVNDDPASPVRGQFLPRIASNPLSGNVMVCWHDARNSTTNSEMQEFCAVATPATAAPAFFPNRQVGMGTSNGTGSSDAGVHDVQYGDFSGLDYFQGRAHPVWADQSNVTGDNPDGMLTYEAQSSRVGGGPMASEGEPHITTVDGVRYDFQAAGDFVAARSASGFEVQVRQSAIPTTYFPNPNPYTGLATCVSINSAVAARVGAHRVTYQQNPADKSGELGMELRIDGALASLGDDGIALSDGGSIVRSAVGGIEMRFPDGALLMAIPGFWQQLGVWYLNLSLTDADAFAGLMGARPTGSWLPALPDGSSLGAIPASDAQRYDMLYRTFADAWRVGEKDSLFDPALAGAQSPSTAAGWPKDQPPCDLLGQEAAAPAQQGVAGEACGGLVDETRRQNCAFDVSVTGESGFAETYMRTERLERWGTTTMLSAQSQKEPGSEPKGFVATPVPRWAFARGALHGSVQFYVDGAPAGEPVKLNTEGRAIWVSRQADEKSIEVTARYLPEKDGSFLPSLSEGIDFGR